MHPLVSEFVQARDLPPQTAQKLNKLMRNVSFQYDVVQAAQKQTAVAAPDDWREWQLALFPKHFHAEPADHHARFWDYLQTIQPNTYHRPYFLILARGGGKSTNLEGAAVYLGATGKRKYCWYLRETQHQADDALSNIQAMLEGSRIEKYYPEMADRQLGKFGQVRAWRRNRLICANGYVIDAIGLDTAVRSSKVVEQRPDLIIPDDLDSKHDTPKTTQKKIEILTTSILPAGAPNCLVLGGQNLILKHGIFSRLAGVADEPCDFLTDRIVDGPHPAVHNLQVEIVEHEDGTISHRASGTPTWEGQNLDIVSKQITTWGLAAFKIESQHEVGDNPDALWNRDGLNLNRVTKAPDLYRIVVAVDPAATTGQTGIVVSGAGKPNNSKLAHGYTLADVSPPHGSKPAVWAAAAVAAYHLYGADAIVGEINNGGDMIEEVIRGVPGGENVKYDTVRASRGKYTRAEPVATLAENGRDHHVGHHVDLENELCTWVPGNDSPNRLDAKVWGYTWLGLTNQIAPSPPKEQPTKKSKWLDGGHTGSRWKVG